MKDEGKAFKTLKTSKHFFHPSSFILHPCSPPCGEGRACAAASFCDDLGEDGEGDFCRRDSADVQPDGRSDLCERRFFRSSFAQSVKHNTRPALTPYQAEVIRLGCDGGAHAFFILVVAARDDGHGDAAPATHTLVHGRHPAVARMD